MQPTNPTPSLANAGTPNSAPVAGTGGVLQQGQQFMGGIVNYDTATAAKLAPGATTLATPNVAPVISASSFGQQTQSIPTSPNNTGSSNADASVSGNIAATNTTNQANQVTQQNQADQIAQGNNLGGTPQSIGGLQQQEQGAQGQYDETTNQIQQLMQQLGYKSTDISNLQQSANISGLTSNITDLNTQLAQKTAAYNNQFQQIGSQNIPTTFVSGQLALAKQAAAVDIAGTSAQLQAAQGNLSTAQDTINNAINLKYGAITDQLTAQEAYLKDNYDNLTNSQKNLADRQTQIIAAQKDNITNQQNTSIQAQKDLQTAITNSTVTAATGYQAMSDYLNGKISLGDFYSQIGQQGAATGTNVGGYDISKYAANPQNAAQVQNYLTQIQSAAGGPITSATQAQQVISQLYPNATITGQMIMNTAQSTGVDPAMLIAMIQNESVGGTSDVATKDNNVAGTTWTGSAAQIAAGLTQGTARPAAEGGYYAKFPSTQASIDYLGQSLAASPATSGRGVPGTTGSPSIDATTPGYTTTVVPQTGGLTQSALDQAALTYATSGVMPTLRGASAGATGAQKTAVQNRAAELNAGGNIAANKATLKSLGATLTQQTEYAANATRAYNTATDNLGTLNSLMTQYGLNQSNIPLVNQFTNAVKGQTGSAGMIAAFKANLEGLRAEYSQVLAKGGTRSVSTDATANALIPDNISPAQLQQVATALSNEGANAVKEANDSVSTIQNQINGIVTPTTTTATIPKGTMTDSQFVEKALSSNKIDYNTFISQVPSGQKAVIDNTTGQAGYIPKNEYDPSKYTSA